MPRKTTKKKSDKPLLLGAHMSISGSMEKAVERGRSIGCTAIQVFLKNNNRWEGKVQTEKEIAAFRAEMAKGDIRAVFGHDSYLINLASPKDDLFEKSIAAMVDEIERATALGVPFIVIHPGSHVGEGKDWGLQRIVSGLNEVFALTPDSDVMIALENTAGQGTNLGYRFEHLADIMAGIKKKKRVGTCVDTCHTFAAGYDLRTKEDYEATIQAFDDVVGLKHLLGLHINDSKKELGSRVDRHEHIGQGHMGLEPFRFVMNDERLADIPKVLETHKGPDMKEDVMNLEVLRGLVE